ncbi:phenylpyruvate tautomerase MIF-related protein [Pseudodesulfovibrio sediminis]|uniref:L-dopachrome isomerase n=1 Tax=Pseudodesulfovibrio sediminis TaxID=2810563 RepID=A0ABM7P4M8_9BACT|nr:phenylpyruvate tautomerase MIF-related protein [Pseudodesulfovibrio sediminis]BCS87729.1 hypothetical protein PSDVSF_09710 [Pseudodesulfovibrio sediminis]
MPFIKVETNISVDDVEGASRKLSALAVRLLGKPEQYVLAIMEPDKALLFGGTADPAAFVSLNSIGLPEDRTTELSQGICSFMQEIFGIPGERVYIAFQDIQRNMFGWNSGTF